MENFNKVLSFVLGLVVVIVFVIVLSGRINLRSDIFTGKKTPTPTAKLATPSPSPTPKEDKNGFFSRLFSRKPKITPTPTIVTQPTPTAIVITETGSQHSQKGGAQGVKEIPATGAPSILLPLFGSSALLGIYLRKRK